MISFTIFCLWAATMIGLDVHMVDDVTAKVLFGLGFVTAVGHLAYDLFLKTV